MGIAVGLFAAFGCTPAAPVPTRPTPAVEVAVVAASSTARDLRLSGTLEADRSIALSFVTAGTVERVLVEQGARVNRGQVLARLAPKTFEDALGMVKAKADQAEDAYRRLEPMHRNQTLPDVKMVEVETALAQARLSVSVAKKNLNDAVLRAPDSGTIAKRQVEPGTTVAPGIPVFVLVQTKTMLAVAPLPETQIARVRTGDATSVFVPALKRTLDGPIRDIGVIADPLTRTYEIKVALPNPSDDLRMGMVAEVRLHVTGDGEATVVPPAAVRVDEDGAPSVFVVAAGNRLQRRQVDVAGFVGESTAVSKGLVDGELVVTSGTPMLADGMIVRIEGQYAKAAHR